MIKKFLFFLLAFLLLFLVFKGIIRSFFWIYLIFVNVLAMFYMYYDKIKAIHHSKSRVPENRLLAIAFAGGAPFMLLSMFIFRHKIMKIKFLIGVPIILVINLIFFYFILRIL
jgi:uncharacterized membrane protein YsdA (DUF1294 family)